MHMKEASQRQTASALEGITVLELCSFVAGPYCARLLADMGADVVKVEHPDGGDPARRRGPFYHDIPGPDNSLLFIYLNLNKRGITLDLGTPTGRQLFLDMAARVDVLIQDLTAGQLRTLGLSIQALHECNPRLIVASITPFGFRGPYSEYKATYLNTYHAGGDAYILPGGQLQDQMYPEREPIKGPGYLGEYQAAVSASAAVLGALMGREQDGRGHHIDTSQQEALAILNAPDLGLYPNGGTVQRRYGQYLPHYIGGLFRCKDGFWEFVINSDRAWEGLVDFMGRPDWAQAPRFRTHDDRVGHRREIEDHIEAWAMAHTREELFHGLQQRGCAVGPAYTPTEVVRDEQMRQRGFWANLDHPALGHIPVPTTGALFPLTPWRLRCPPPSLGQHNQDIYCGWLGIKREDLAAVRRAGII